MTVLMRNPRGDVIHREGCPAVGRNAVRWRWADANPDVDWELTSPWLTACKRCSPPSPAAAEQAA